MKTFRVYYTGNSTRFKHFEEEVTANSEREAVEKAYAKFLDQSYFPQDDGSIRDCDGELIANPSDNVIEYDGGVFKAEAKKEYSELYTVDDWLDYYKDAGRSELKAALKNLQNTRDRGKRNQRDAIIALLA